MQMGVAGTNHLDLINNRLQKDTMELIRNIDNLSNEQAKIFHDFENGRIDTFKVEIKPNGGYYHGGTFLFKIILDEKYPFNVPSVICLTKLYHPNINCLPFYDDNDEDNVCVSVLEEWQPLATLEDLVQGILYLFYQPNLDDILSPIVSCEPKEDFAAKVKRSLLGGEVEGAVFERNFWT
ncbi:uncharacterized protein LOC141907236 [Tubulanus polymorphus]|uniref:uncharacterized protein LOC141907236 n=1 Tax=Tubulanus polymorphus TaxID=672921 RepID=UPI003DA5155A